LGIFTKVYLCFTTRPKVSPEQKPLDDETDDNTVDNENSKGEMNVAMGHFIIQEIDAVYGQTILLNKLHYLLVFLS